MKLSCPVVGAIVLACCGCTSAPVRYYSLLPPEGSPSEGRNNVCCIVDIRGVHIPVEVDRPELVTRRSGEQLDVLGNDVWLAPLRDEIKSALLDRIKHDLSDTAAPANPPATQRFVVSVDVERFESVLGQHALMKAQWHVDAADHSKSHSVAPCETTVSIGVSGGVPALVLGHQQAIVGIADRIAAAVADFRLTGESHCLS